MTGVQTCALPISVAGLIKQGYLANPWIGDSGAKMTEREMASILHGKTLGAGTHKINNIGAVNQLGAADSLVLVDALSVEKTELNEGVAFGIEVNLN